MSNDRSHGIERAARESDCHVAALLSSALIAREPRICAHPAARFRRLPMQYIFTGACLRR